MNRFKPIRTLLAGLVVVSPLLAFAAPGEAEREAARRLAEQLQKQEQERLRFERESNRPSETPNGTDLKTLLPSGKNDKTPSGVCRQIDHIELVGATRVSRRRLDGLVAGFEGRCLTAHDLERLLGELTRLYILEGWVASRAYLPAQDLTRKVLTVSVNEGKVERITVQDGKDGHSVNLSTAFPGVQGQPLNLRDLEQGVEQLNRVTGNRATLDIRPGSRPGDSEVVIGNETGRRIAGSLSWDNQGSVSTGQEQVGGALSLGNLLGWNDSLSLSHRENLHRDPAHRESVSDSVTIALPWGYSLFSLGTSRSRYTTTVTTPGGTSLKFNGTNQTDTFRIDRTVLRNQSMLVSASANLSLKDAKNYIADQLLAVSSRRLSVLDLEVSVSDRLGGGNANFRLGYSRGLKAFGAMADTAGLTHEDPRAQFEKFTLNGSYFLPFFVFGQEASLASQLTSQMARDALYGSEQISIGGLYSVRGFRNNTLSGDNGVYLRNTLTVQKPLQLYGHSAGLRLFAGLDAGQVSSVAQGVPSGSLVGGTVGLGVSFGPVSWELSHSKAISQPGFMPHEGGQTWASVSVAF